jgi:hypothetical protein
MTATGSFVQSKVLRLLIVALVVCAIGIAISGLTVYANPLNPIDPPVPPLPTVGKVFIYAISPTSGKVLEYGVSSSGTPTMGQEFGYTYIEWRDTVRGQRRLYLTDHVLLSLSTRPIPHPEGGADDPLLVQTLRK